MKKLIKILGILIFTSLCYYPSSAIAQNFTNLDFESSRPVSIPNSPYYPFAVTFQSALPGWTGYLGTTQTTQALYNDEFLGIATIDIVGAANLDGGLIDGNFTAVLQAGTNPFGSGNVSASIVQTGTVPIIAQSLDFKAWGGDGPWTVSFAGNNLVPVPLSTGQTVQGQPYMVYGVDISQYVGQTGALEFTANPGTVRARIRRYYFLNKLRRT